ncbi:MAG: class I SAM-dependent methyltransferase [Chloroflexi bacterium]|nr:class I SAM-dependent methyltransferase [Chloroflexota bacterium]
MVRMVLDVSPWHEIQLDIDAIEKDRTLFDIANFLGRVEAIDRLEFHILGRIQSAHADSPAKNSIQLKERAERLRNRLEETNARLFRKLRARIKSGSLTGEKLKRELDKYGGDQDGFGKYDALDVLVGGLLRLNVSPQETQPREPEMVFYQPTPAHIILELAGKMTITPDAVFYDLGSGLGQVCILVHLLTGVRAKGIELEPGYCEYAQKCAHELNLSRVEFIKGDARTADFSDGTHFFLFTPFKGSLLKQVLRQLRRVGEKRRISIYTYGPCTLDISKQMWLRRVDQNPNTEYSLASFAARRNVLEEK